jgi:hypothetical protein
MIPRLGDRSSPSPHPTAPSSPTDAELNPLAASAFPRKATRRRGGPRMPGPQRMQGWRRRHGSPRAAARRLHRSHRARGPFPRQGEAWADDPVGDEAAVRRDVDDVAALGRRKAVMRAVAMPTRSFGTAGALLLSSHHLSARAGAGHDSAMLPCSRRRAGRWSAASRCPSQSEGMTRCSDKSRGRGRASERRMPHLRRVGDHREPCFGRRCGKASAAATASSRLDHRTRSMNIPSSCSST